MCIPTIEPIIIASKSFQIIEKENFKYIPSVGFGAQSHNKNKMLFKMAMKICMLPKTVGL